MIYQGNKAKLRKYILPILQDCIDKNDISFYIEPFVGGANMIDHIRCRNRIGSDCNGELISLLKYMQSDHSLSIFPEDCDFGHYADVRENRKNKTGKYSDEYTAGIGYFASYAGRYFDGGFGKDPSGKRNIYKERLKYAKEQAPLLNGIEFYERGYDFYSKDGCPYMNCVFYLDPPYKSTKPYGKEVFDYEHFYDFCRRLSESNFVFISEYNMPSDFKCIWSKERKVSQKSDRKTADIAQEKLFMI